MVLGSSVNFPLLDWTLVGGISPPLSSQISCQADSRSAPPPQDIGGVCGNHPGRNKMTSKMLDGAKAGVTSGRQLTARGGAVSSLGTMLGTTHDISISPFLPSLGEIKFYSNLPTHPPAQSRNPKHKAIGPPVIDCDFNLCAPSPLSQPTLRQPDMLPPASPSLQMGGEGRSRRLEAQDGG